MKIEWTKEDMERLETAHQRERPRRYPARGVLNEVATLAVEIYLAKTHGVQTITPETPDGSERLWPEAYVITHPHPFEDDGTGRSRCGKRPDPGTWVQCGFRREDHVVRYLCSATCTHDDAATPGHPERVKERSEAVLAAAASIEDTADGIAELSEDDSVEGESDAYDRGAEAMRAACWEAVQRALEPVFPRSGWALLWDDLKAGIEGAAP